MKRFWRIFLFVGWFARAAGAQDVDPSVAVEDRTAGRDLLQRYFLIRHRLSPGETPKEYGLLLVLPGGGGGADFLPFCANVITALGTPKDFLVAELVAPVWGKRDDSTVVWPGKAFPQPAARFSSEDFVAAVIDDVSTRNRIHDGWVFTLGWSSSGHVLYSSSFENPKIRASFVAMSRFQPAWFTHPENAKGKRYYFWHSPDDTVCPSAEADFAASYLTKLGASTVLKTYKGGHGWQPYTFYADRIKEALEWFRAGDTEASVMQKKMSEAKIGGEPKSPGPLIFRDSR